MLLTLREFVYYNEVGLVLLLPLFFVFLMCMVDLKRTKMLFSVFFSNQYFYTYRTDVFSTSVFYRFFGFGFISSLLALFFIPFFYDGSYIYRNFIPVFLEFFLSAIMYSFIKNVFGILFNYLTIKSKVSKQMLVLETSYLASVLAMLYFIIAYVFLHLNHQEIMLKVMLISGLILYGIRLVAVLLNNKNLLSGKLFYIILYLCILEILPLIYLFKCYVA